MTFIAVRCPHCQSEQIVKRGKTARGTQRYLCQNPLYAKDSFLPDFGRTPNEHLAFGLGEHCYLGAELARQEVRVMVETLLARLPDIALVGPVERLRSGFMADIKHMPVRFTTRAPQAERIWSP